MSFKILTNSTKNVTNVTKLFVMLEYIFAVRLRI